MRFCGHYVEKMGFKWVSELGEQLNYTVCTEELGACICSLHICFSIQLKALILLQSKKQVYCHITDLATPI